jgi:metal-responsive CopG/Arc/MetJ family transcriptional regulator
MKVLAMMKETIRTHVVLPRDLVTTVDSLAGKRTRSEFVEEALREKVARERLGKALAETAGSLNLADHPEWATPEKVSAWVHNMRNEENEATERALRRD